MVLLFYPRQSPGEMMDTGQEVRRERGERVISRTHVATHSIPMQDVDEVYYGRLVLLLTLSLFLAGGSVALFFIQCTETIYAKEKRMFYITS